MSDRLTAIHESAHATVAQQFGFSVRRVVLHSPGSGSVLAGRCEIADMRTELDVDPIRVLIYLAAGGAAEKRLTGRPSSSDQRDRQQATVLASAILEQPETHPRVRGLMESAALIADALMLDPHVWAAVQRVAAALARTGTLSGRDVQLLREARR